MSHEHEGDANHIPVGFPHPDDDDASDTVASLINDWEPPSLRSDPGETRARIAIANAHHVPLRERMHRAACQLGGGLVGSDGTVKLPREAAQFLASLMHHMAETLPTDTHDYQTAFDRGWGL